MGTKKTSSRARKPREERSSRSRRTKPAARLLSVKEIQSLLKPPENFEELADKAIEAWNRVRARVATFDPGQGFARRRIERPA